MQASNAFVSAGAAAPDEFYDAYSMYVEGESYWARARRRFFHHRMATFSLFLFAALVVLGFVGNRIAPFGYEEVNINALSSAPTWAHPFGTDQVGRDYLSRSLLGLRTEVEIALLIGFFGTLIGTTVGAVAGYLGGILDNAVMRFADLLLTFPPMISVLVAATFLHVDTLFKVSVLLACLMWMPVARVVRSTALALREREYVDAARAMGAGDARIVLRHILPNAISSVAVAASVMTASAVILETTLSFLGVGIGLRYNSGRTDTKLPSLGDVMAAASGEGLFHWWGIVFPGLVVVLLIVPIYFVGDGIRDALDPTPRRYVSERELARRRRGPSRLTRLLRRVPWPSLPRLRTPGWMYDLVDRLPRRRARVRTGRRLVLEAFAVIGLTLAAAAAIYVWKVNPVHSEWQLAGTAVQNVSRADGAQTQVSVAVAPRRSSELLAASNDSDLRTVRVYASADGGRTWTSHAGPSLGVDACARGEPAAAIDGRGRQYVAFSVTGECSSFDPAPYVVVAVRASASSPWTLRRLGPHRPADFWDAAPSLAVGPDGRVYAAWSRLLTWTSEGIAVSSSGDGGRTWSRPVVIAGGLSHPQLASVTVSPDGTLYVAGVDAHFGIWLARSTDRGETFRVARVAALPYNRAASCSVAGAHPTPYETIRCVGPNPDVAATRSRVYVTYGVGWVGEPQSVRIGIFDARLHRLADAPIATAARNADRFWPTVAADPASGRVWACYYDTSGDPSRKQAWFTCAVSADGRRWSRPLRAAAHSARPDVLWEDARVYLFGDQLGYGGYTGLAAAGGTAFPLWIDTPEGGAKQHEIFAARLQP